MVQSNEIDLLGMMISSSQTSPQCSRSVALAQSINRRAGLSQRALDIVALQGLF